jgi:hypothetical protein
MRLLVSLLKGLNNPLHWFYYVCWGMLFWGLWRLTPPPTPPPSPKLALALNKKYLWAFVDIGFYNILVGC